MVFMGALLVSPLYMFTTLCILLQKIYCYMHNNGCSVVMLISCSAIAHLTCLLSHDSSELIRQSSDLPFLMDSALMEGLLVVYMWFGEYGQLNFKLALV
ncbi:hypothetical protein L2E82_31589 [Cichorium intybus]|uniref:Uncharacterized protein n=1 Tax=Cichorium intybus TaxID=13427 RepID=A0ACB9BF67_CICIN|nr:hypothetical protein L2E82_31589 [Cichorium intybus]